MTDIGKKIKMLREERNLTMDMIVADINARFRPVKPFNKSMISRWENEDNEPSLENAKLLSMYFDVSVDYLIGVTDTRTPSRLLHIKKPDANKPRIIHVGPAANVPIEVFVKGSPKVATIKAPKGTLKTHLGALKAPKAGKSTVVVKKVAKTRRPKRDKV